MLKISNIIQHAMGNDLPDNTIVLGYTEDGEEVRCIEYWKKTGQVNLGGEGMELFEHTTIKEILQDENFLPIVAKTIKAGEGFFYEEDGSQSKLFCVVNV